MIQAYANILSATFLFRVISFVLYSTLFDLHCSILEHTQPGTLGQVFTKFSDFGLACIAQLKFNVFLYCNCSYIAICSSFPESL